MLNDLLNAPTQAERDELRGLSNQFRDRVGLDTYKNGKGTEVRRELQRLRKLAEERKKPVTIEQAGQRAANDKQRANEKGPQVSSGIRSGLERDQAVRGGKSKSQERTETPGTYENAVARGRKFLNITEGSEDDKLLKSAMWTARNNDGSVDEVKVAELYKRLRDEKHKVKSEVDAYIFERDQESKLPFTREQYAKANELGQREFKGNDGQIYTTEQVGRYYQSKGVNPVSNQTSEQIQEQAAAPTASFAGNPISEKDLLARIDKVSGDVGGFAGPVGRFLGESLIGGPAKGVLQLAAGLGDTERSPQERLGLVAEGAFNAIPAVGNVAVKFGGKVLKPLLSGLKIAYSAGGEGLVGAVKLARELGIDDDLAVKLAKQVRDNPQALDDVLADPRIAKFNEAQTVPETQVPKRPPPDTLPTQNTTEVANKAAFSNYEAGKKYHKRVPEVTYLNPANIDFSRNLHEVTSVPDNVAKQMKFTEPIEVSVFSDGRIVVNNGHHRLAAAKQRGLDSIPVEITAINAKGERLNDLVAESDAIAGPPLLREATWNGSPVQIIPDSFNESMGVYRVLKADGTIDYPPQQEVQLLGIPEELPVAQGRNVNVTETPKVIPPAPKLTETTPPKSVKPVEGQGITQAETAKIRAKLDIEQYVKTSKPIKSLLKEADSVDGLTVARSVINKKRAVSDVEQAAMLKSWHKVTAEQESLATQAAKLGDEGNFEELAKVDAKIQSLNQDAQELLEGSDIAGSEWGRSGRARQLEIANSDDPNVLRYRYYKASGGEKPTPEFQKLLDDHNQLKAKVADLEAKQLETEAQLADKLIGSPARAKARVNYTRKTSKADYEAAVKKWQSGGVKPGSKQRGAAIRITDEQWKSLKTIARYHLDNNIESAVEIANRILEVTGDAVDKLTIYRAIKEAAVDESRALNMGRALGEEYLQRGANAIESKELRNARFAADRRLADIRNNLREVERQADFNQKSAAAKAFSLFKETVGTTRSILSSGDLSAPFRQGLVMMAARPLDYKMSGKAFGNMVKSFTQKGYDQAMWELTQSPRWNEAVSGKLAITDAGGGLLPREEAFISNILERIPVVKNVANAWTGWSERTYTGFLNTIRMNAFETYVNLLEDGGTKLTREDLQGIADWVNLATGRGDLGKFEKNADVAAQFLFSPRFLKSRLDLATAKPLRNLAKNTKGPVEQLVAREYAKSMGVIGTTLGLAALAGMTEPDPRSSRFGKIKIGDILVDVTGGISGSATYLSRMAAWAASSLPGQEKLPVRKTWKGGPMTKGSPFADPMKMTGDFALGKSSPPVRAVYYGGRGTDFKGDKTNIGKEFGKQLAPIGIQNLMENKKEGLSNEQALLAFLLDFFGFSTTSDKPKPKKRDRD